MVSSESDILSYLRPNEIQCSFFKNLCVISRRKNHKEIDFVNESIRRISSAVDVN